jgi:hypothetical protein
LIVYQFFSTAHTISNFLMITDCYGQEAHQNAITVIDLQENRPPPDQTITYPVQEMWQLCRDCVVAVFNFIYAAYLIV